MRTPLALLGALFAAGVVGAVGLSGCHTTTSLQARTLDMDDSDGDGHFNQPIEPNAEDVKLPPVIKGPVVYSLLGARADLRLAPALASDATCECLAAVVGNAANTAFQWEETYPKTNPDTQLVIAFSAENVLCGEAGADSMGPSYWGYEISGNDLVVVVENAVAGPPITTGAIIPKPPEGGRVLVRPLNKSVPYGASLDDPKNRCVLAVKESKVIPDLPKAGELENGDVKPMSQEQPLTLTPAESPNE
jgi:hypothetical protein